MRAFVQKTAWLLAWLLAMGWLALPCCAETVRVRYLTWETSYQQLQLTRKLMDAFHERHPDIRIQLEASTDASRIFLTDAAAGTPPDVMYVTSEFLAQLVDKRVVLPLDELVSRDGVDMAMFLPQTVEGCTFEGRLHAYPIHFSTDALFYNKRLFDECGVPYPDGNWTWEQFRDAATSLTLDRDRDGRTDVFGCLQPDYMLLVRSFGGTIVTADGSRCVAHSPEAVRAIEFGFGLQGRQAPTAAQAMDTNDMQMFANGRLAMFCGRTWQLPQLIRTMKDVPWDVAPIPRGRERFCLIAVGGHCIARGSAHQDAAWQWVKFYSSPEGQKLLGLQKNCVPALAELANSEDHFLAAPPASSRVFLDAAAYGAKTIPDTPWSTEFGSRIWFPALERMRAYPDSYPAARALRDIEQRGNDLVARWQGEKAAAAQIDPDADTTAFLYYFMVGLIAAGLLGLASVARTNRRYWEGYLFIGPWLVGFVLFTLGPVLASLYLSFCRYDLLTPARWVGLQNVRELLADPLFARSLWNTLYYCAFTVPLSLTLSLGLALMLNVRMRGAYTFRAVYYLPALTSGVAVSLLWRWIYNPELGLFNSFLGYLGVDGPDWLTSQTWAMPAIIIMSVWGGLGGPMLIYLAGLQGIPQQLYEAAEIDGANWWRKFWSVTVPMLSPSIFFNLIMAIIGSFQVFTTVFVMTGNTAASMEPGGPANTTLVYVLHLYQTGFRYLAMGKACAMAWILFLIILGLTLWNYRMSRRWVHYDQV